MTRVLVTGGTGFVGRTLCPALLAAGHEVCVSSRNPRAAEAAEGVEVRPVSALGPDTDWGAALAPSGYPSRSSPYFSSDFGPRMSI